MPIETSVNVIKENSIIVSDLLQRTVTVDFYATGPVGPETSLLLLNDGQDLERLGFTAILEDLAGRGMISPLLCVGIYAGAERTMEYGTAGRPDFKGWGAKADAYTRFVFGELIPSVRERYKIPSFRQKAFAGFSLGALSALDIVWHHPQEFARAGLFSGSFWWRSVDKSDPAYDEHIHRIMANEVRKGDYYPWLKFFFECGTEDETEDRNGNGIIDSIDDTLDLIDALASKGYDRDRDIRYLEIPGGRHEVGTWATAMPEFLQWSFPK